MFISLQTVNIREYDTHEIVKGLLMGKLTIMPVTVLMKKVHLKEIGGFQQPRYYPAVEHPTWLKLALQGKFIYTNTVLGYWRRHLGQATDTFGLKLADGLMKINLEYYHSLPDNMKSMLQITSEQLQSRNNELVSNAYFSSGRYHLLKRDKLTAKKYFRIALRRGNLRTKIKAAMGLLSIYAHFDLELIPKLLGRGTYR